MKQTAFFILLLGLFQGCASTAPEVRTQLHSHHLMGRWKETSGKGAGWLDISCQGQLNVKSESGDIEEGVITEMGSDHFVASPNPFNQPFSYHTWKDRKSGRKQLVVTVSPVPESNILKISNALSRLIGRDNTLVFKKVESYSCM